MGLFKPAWMSSNWRDTDKAIRAVEKEYSQQKLFIIANNAPNVNVRLAAIRKLTDQDALTYLAKISIERHNILSWDEAVLIDYVRMAAAVKLTDQTPAQNVYAAVAITANGWNDCTLNEKKDSVNPERDMCYEAVRRLTDQGLLAEVAKESIHQNVCIKAVEKISDQKLLADVAKCGYGNIMGCLAAAEKLTDQALLADVASHAYTKETVVKAVADKLTDKNLAQEALDAARKNADRVRHTVHDTYR